MAPRGRRRARDDLSGLCFLTPLQGLTLTRGLQPNGLHPIELRRRIHVGLNKGEARNALARAVFFNRLGELRDRTYENQRHRACGLNLVVAAIVLWNTVYLELAIGALRQRGEAISDDLLAHLSPLKWEHINLTGDYHWRRDGGLRNRKLRPLRQQPLIA
jgi:hypothetical protein